MNYLNNAFTYEFLVLHTYKLIPVKQFSGYLDSLNYALGFKSKFTGGKSQYEHQLWDTSISN